MRGWPFSMIIEKAKTQVDRCAPETKAAWPETR
jgi:hypothetical protein